MARGSAPKSFSVSPCLCGEMPVLNTNANGMRTGVPSGSTSIVPGTWRRKFCWLVWGFPATQGDSNVSLNNCYCRCRNPVRPRTRGGAWCEWWRFHGTIGNDGFIVHEFPFVLVHFIFDHDQHATRPVVDRSAQSKLPSRRLSDTWECGICTWLGL